MTDEDLAYIIKKVADEAWGIAYMGRAAPEVCLAIEDLSDDPKTRQKLMAEIRHGLEQPANPEKHNESHDA